MSPCLGIANDVEESNDVGPACEVLKDLDLALDLLFLHRLEDLDHTLVVGRGVDAFKDFRVLWAEAVRGQRYVPGAHSARSTCREV